jgi:hypothetical protein
VTAISPIGAVQARIQQIELQIAMRRPGSVSTSVTSAASAAAGAPASSMVLGASAATEVGGMGTIAGAAANTMSGTTAADGIASALGLDDPAVLGSIGAVGAPSSLGSLETTLPTGGTFDEVFSAAVQRLRAGWSTSAVPAATAGVHGVVPSVDATTAAGTTGAPAVVGGVPVAGSVSPSTPYAAMFETAGARHGIPPRVLAAVGYVESRFRTDAISSAGAVGMMQFLPGTAASMGVDPYDPASAIDGAARYLRHGLDRFGSLEEAIAAYNVGPGTISRAGGVLPGTQAERYLMKVIEATGTV